MNKKHVSSGSTLFSIDGAELAATAKAIFYHNGPA
jgi:hypothetical protein